jgi:protein fantom
MSRRRAGGGAGGGGGGGVSAMEEKYLSERDRNILLKRKTNEQEDTIKRLYTKIQMIEETLRRRGAKGLDGKGGGTAKGGGKGGAGSSTGRRIADLEAEKLINDLRKRNGSLKKANTDLREKLRVATIALNKANRRPGMGSRGRTAAPARDENLDGMLQSLNRSASGTPHAKKTRELVSALRSRLHNAEQQNQRLTRENSKLRQNGAASGASSGRLPPAAPSARSSANHHHGVGGLVSGDVLELQRELRNKDAQLTLLNSRFEHLESRSRAAQEIHNKTLSKLEEDNMTIRDQRRRLQMLQHDNEVLEGERARFGDLEAEVAELRGRNLELEESIGRLCESPFIENAYKSEKEHMDLRRFKKDARHTNIQLEYLQEQVKKHSVALTEYKQQVQGLHLEKESLAKEKAELQVQVEEYMRSNDLLKDKMRLYSGDSGIDTADLERALTLVKRRTEVPAELDFLEKTDADDLETVPALRNKAQNLQIKILEQVRELERSERMLQAQSSINRDINTELEALQKRFNSESSTLHKRCSDLEILASKRLQRVKTLEAQLKQYIAGGGMAGGLGMSLDGSGGAESSLTIKNNMLAPGMTFEPGENLLEVFVVSGSFAAGPGARGPGAIMFNGESVALTGDSTTFVMCDFYDYETQTTPLLVGQTPQYNFSATYKLETDHFFLRYLSTDSLVLEVNLARNADFQLIAQCTLPLRELLDEAGEKSWPEAPMLSVRDGSIIGTLNIQIKLAVPVTELFQLYLKENPEEKARMERLRLADRELAEEAAEAARQENNLEVVIVRAQDLRTRTGDAPSAYVGYKLLGFQPVASEIVGTSVEPVFDHVQVRFVVVSWFILEWRSVCFVFFSPPLSLVWTIRSRIY